MNHRKAERVRILKRWRARLYALAFTALRGRIAIDPTLLADTNAYVQAERRSPVILVAHHTPTLYLLFRVVENWPGRVLVLASDASSRYLRLLKACGMVPGRLEMRQALTLRDLQAIAQGNAVLFALADVNIGVNALFHHPVDGRLRVFSAGWAELAYRLSARVVCLRAEAAWLSATISFKETGLGATPYETAAAALDWFFDSEQRVRAWDFHAAGVMAPRLVPVRGQADIKALYRNLAASALHYVGFKQGE